MKRYNYILLLICSLVHICFTSCTNDVYSDDSDIVLPPREVIEVTPVMGSWKMKSMDAVVETGIPQLNEGIKQGILSNPFLQVFKNFNPTFVFGVKNDVTLVTPIGSISAGTYEYKDETLDFHMVVSGLGAMGIPDIDMEISLPVKISEDGKVLTGTLDARMLVIEQLQQFGIDPENVKVDLVITLKQDSEEEEEDASIWNIKSMNAVIETGIPQLNETIGAQVMENILLKTIMAMQPSFKANSDGSISLVVGEGAIPAGSYTYDEETGKLHFDLELKGLEAVAGIPDISMPLDMETGISEDGTLLTAHLDIHFLLPDIGIDLSAARTELEIILERAE